METILAEKINYNRKEIKCFLQLMDNNWSYEIEQLVFYPYIFFEYSIKKRKKFFQPLGTSVGCTIDGVNQIGALIDRSPHLIDEKIPLKKKIPNKLTIEQAQKISEQFLLNTLVSRTKILSLPKLTLTHAKFFYRPYWVVRGLRQSTQTFLVTVDAVSGKYHPL